MIRACPLGRCGSTRHRRAGICSPSFVRLHDRDRPRRLASHEDLFPSANQAETRCPCCHASDDPALALSLASCRRAFHTACNRAFRLCGFSLAFPSPFRRSAYGPKALETPAGGSCIASFLRGAVPLSADLAQPCPDIFPGHRSWDLTLRSVVPVRKRRDVSIAPVPHAVC